jgi:AraC family transcriptional regulator, regulatory protein of adaptative response / DNA-3-methyladenine glycosylase II
LAARAIPGVEVARANSYRRSLDLPYGRGVVSLTPDDGHVRAVFALEDLRDLTAAVARCRHLLNLDSDPVAVDDALSKDALLRPLVRRSPGLRVPGAASGFEIAIRAVVGQQVSVAGARTIAGRLVNAAGSSLDDTDPGITHTFPSPGALADLALSSPDAFGMPAGRRRAVLALSEAVANGDLVIDPGADPSELAGQLEDIPGIGSWTSSYVVMRALGHPDVFMPTDLGLRRSAARMGTACDLAALTSRAERWRPWRSYAMCHLWSAHRDEEHRDEEHRDEEHRDEEHRDEEHRDEEHRGDTPKDETPKDEGEDAA